MSVSIFDKVPNYTFTENDEKAKNKLSDLRIKACSELHQDYKSQRIVTLFQEMSQTQLYKVLKTMPKACIHHLHFDCCQDQQFYAQHVATDPIVYLNKGLDAFHLGTKQQAEKEGWVSMKQAKLKFPTQRDFIKHISNFTMLNKKQLAQNFTISSGECWDRFENKICHIFPILAAQHLFKKYTLHILRKFIKNGYDRLQFRSLLTCLTEYNQTGEVIKVHTQKKFMQTFDQAFDIVKKQHPPLTVGFIFFALKFLTVEQNDKILTTVLAQNWDKTIGIDFVQQEDPNGSQAPYDQIANKALAKFPHCKGVKKVYHVGETKNHLNNNVEIAINAGTARIGHGINVLQHPQLLAVCKEKNICFQQSPISNMILNYVKDPRTHPAQLILGLGIPLTVNPDDPARFGLQDSTMDFFVLYVSSNWSLKHLKLVVVHSINHAICSEQTKKQLFDSFTKRWDAWVASVLAQ